MIWGIRSALFFPRSEHDALGRGLPTREIRDFPILRGGAVAD